ncbi:aldo/keto reductase [Microbacterium sp. NPDC056736]|jgi:aryl-alcohol dehydrogenase-like predicted oxidoreductase|uniref:aldo/keto reductase n=1 Tax=Microbacterium sp. NPDC056736 TaxID=3345932 RepID=UPI003670D3C9
MAFFGVDSTLPSVSPDAAAGALGPHPSAPIPVQGPSVGSNIRVPLGESGSHVFPLILGAAEFGWNVDLESSHAILDTYAELGGNAVHTADSYSSGRSEHIIGQWLHSRGLRDDIVLTVRVGGHADNPGLGPVNLIRAVEASLTRLRTDRIDVLSLDATTDPGSSLEDTLATAEWLVDTGKVRALGAFGYTAAQLVEARIFSSAGYPRITVLDVPFNVLRRHEFDADLRLVAGAQGMAVTPSHALEHGFLAGRQRSKIRGALSVRGAQLAANLNRRGSRTLRALDAVGADLGVPDAAVAVAWLLSQRLVTAPIVNAYAPQHVEELVQGVGVRLSRSQLADIGRASE